MYSTFRTSGDWKDWANNVKNWINAGSSCSRTNGVDMDWETTHPDRATCKANRTTVGYKIYIYCNN
ncbi:hypothetical protein GC194_01655 [bacterium]|nr:hypothetical protein [bacterium]